MLIDRAALAKKVRADRNKDGTIVYRWRFQLRPGCRPSGTCDTENEAIDTMERLMRAEHGEMTVVPRRLFDALGDYIADLEGHDSESRHMRRIRDTLIDHLGEDPWIHNLTAGQIRAWMISVLGTTANVRSYDRNGRPVSGHRRTQSVMTPTANKWLSMLRTALALAEMNRHVHRNEAKLVKMLKLTPQEKQRADLTRQCYRLNEVMAIIEWLLEHDVESAKRVVLLMGLGPRSGALIIRHCDVRWDTREVLCIQGKGSSSTWRPASDVVMAILSDALSEITLRGEEIKPDTVLIGRHHRAKRGVLEDVNEAREDLHIDGGGKSLQCFRASWATHQAAVGVSEWILRDIGGWSGGKIIRNHYVRSVMDHERVLTPIISDPRTHRDRVESGEFTDASFAEIWQKIRDEFETRTSKPLSSQHSAEASSDSDRR